MIHRRPALALVTAVLLAGTRSDGRRPAPARSAPLGPTRTSCGFGSLLQVRIEPSGPPIVGDLLTLDVIVTNTLDPGRHVWWLDVPDGALETGAAPLRWTGWLDRGESRRSRVLARVMSLEPFPLGAWFGPEDDRDRRSLLGEHVLEITPVERRDGELRAPGGPAAVSQANRRSRRITLRNGDHASLETIPRIHFFRPGRRISAGDK